MQSTNSSARWKRWFRPGRLVPLLTILGAATVLVLSLLKVFQLDLPDEVIIALLALLAIDALTERLGLLENIEVKLAGLSVGQALRKRADIPPIEEQALYGSEICIAAISAISVVVRYQSVFESKLRAGCNVRVILLDPSSPALQTWNLLGKTPVDSDIRSALEYFKGFSQVEGARGKCEVRLLNVFLPFSMLAVDPQEDSGSMVIEYHAYKMPFNERPHVFLTQRGDPWWFAYYKQQFEKAWSDARVWMGDLSTPTLQVEE